MSSYLRVPCGENRNTFPSNESEPCRRDVTSSLPLFSAVRLFKGFFKESVKMTERCLSRKEEMADWETTMTTTTTTTTTMIRESLKGGDLDVLELDVYLETNKEEKE
ncbi:hypothetical protein V1477_000374 [Vespula maculifrons]|uniref:Uncharacterized protein n=1 Tax=Vespula maculifrons TaxID=7453 RepID=A0ABD2D1M8_VESMC